MKIMLIGHARHGKDTVCELIRGYNSIDPARLGRELFAENDIYCGLRHREEFEAMKAEGLFDICIWVDAHHRLPPEPIESMMLTKDDSDVMINNNHSLASLRVDIGRLVRYGILISG